MLQNEEYLRGKKGLKRKYKRKRKRTFDDFSEVLTTARF